MHHDKKYETQEANYTLQIEVQEIDIDSITLGFANHDSQQIVDSNLMHWTQKHSEYRIVLADAQNNQDYRQAEEIKLKILNQKLDSTDIQQDINGSHESINPKDVMQAFLVSVSVCTCLALLLKACRDLLRLIVQKKQYNSTLIIIEQRMPQFTAAQINTTTDSTDINSFTAVRGEPEQEYEECAVCLGKLDPKIPCRKTPCDHIFHQPCLDKWLFKQATCPICRQLVLTM